MNRQFELCNDEIELVNLVQDKLKNYKDSSKNIIQKQNELFHLLCFLNIDEKLYLHKYIKPNEPGDFIIEFKGKKILIEVTECFGNDKSYMALKSKMNNLFYRKNKEVGKYEFDIEEAKNKLNKIINSKNNKNYNYDNKYDDMILLIVTGEYSGCSATGNWLIKHLNIDDIKKCNYKIWVLNYFGSPKDGNPIIIKDIVKDIKEFQKYFDMFN